MNFPGLSVEVFLDQSNYMLNKLSKKAGARLVIHDPAVPPLADEYGIDLQPNTASSISIQQALLFTNYEWVIFSFYIPFFNFRA